MPRRQGAVRCGAELRERLRREDGWVQRSPPWDGRHRGCHRGGVGVACGCLQRGCAERTPAGRLGHHQRHCHHRREHRAAPVALHPHTPGRACRDLRPQQDAGPGHGRRAGCRRLAASREGAAHPGGACCGGQPCGAAPRGGVDVGGRWDASQGAEVHADGAYGGRVPEGEGQGGWVQEDRDCGNAAVAVRRGHRSGSHELCGRGRKHEAGVAGVKVAYPWRPPPAPTTTTRTPLKGVGSDRAWGGVWGGGGPPLTPKAVTTHAPTLATTSETQRKNKPQPPQQW